VKPGDLVKYDRSPENHRCTLAAKNRCCKDIVGVILSAPPSSSIGVQRLLVHWLDVNSVTYENARYLEVLT